MIKQLIIDGMDVMVPRRWHSFRLERLYKRGRTEEDIRIAILLCDQHKLSIDVGAAHGWYTYFMARHSRTVHAFEPIETLYRKLKRRVPPNVEVHNLALSDHRGIAEMRVPRSSTCLATIESGNLLRSVGPVELFPVSVNRLDAFGFDDVGFVKVDVEGHERAVLRGAIGTLARNKPAVMIELEERHRSSAVDVTVVDMADLGYDCFYFDGRALSSFRNFVPAKHQDPRILMRDSRSGNDRYINNFFFLNGDHLTKISRVLDIVT